MEQSTETKKKLADLTPEERRAYDRQKKAESRSRLRAASEAAFIPTADEWRERFVSEHSGLSSESDDYAARFEQAVLFGTPNVAAR